MSRRRGFYRIGVSSESRRMVRDEAGAEASPTEGKRR